MTFLADSERRNPTLKEIWQTLRAHLPELRERYGITGVGIFGSYVRNEPRPDSDLDILVELETPPRISLLGLVNLENEVKQDIPALRPLLQ